MYSELHLFKSFNLEQFPSLSSVYSVNIFDECKLVILCPSIWGCLTLPYKSQTMHFDRNYRCSSSFALYQEGHDINLFIDKVNFDHLVMVTVITYMMS